MKNGWKKRIIAIVVCMSLVISASGIVIAAESGNQIAEENLAVQNNEIETEAVKDEMESETESEIQTELITEKQTVLQTEINAESIEPVTEEFTTESQTEYESEIQGEAEMPEESIIQTENNTSGSREFVYTDGTVEVKATLSSADILPEGVTFKVDRITDNDGLEEVEKQLTDIGNSQKDGFLAYDIRFEKDNQEVEPQGEVFVSMNFVEAVKPEQTKSTEDVLLQDVSVLHFKEIQDQIQVEELSDAQINMTEKAEVNSVEFTTDSFSKFLIFWQFTSFSAGSVSVEYVDQKGKAITGPNDNSINIRFGNGEEVNIAKRLADPINYYTYEKAVLKSDTSVEVKRLKVQTTDLFKGIFYYSPTDAGNDWVEVTTLESGKENPNAAIQLVYVSVPADLTQVETVSTPNVKINLFDYKDENKTSEMPSWAEQQIGTEYNQNWGGAVIQGLVKNELDPNGYPFAVVTGKNLETLYGPDAIKDEKSAAIPADKLFQIDEEGYYVFDSAKNYAYLDQTQLVDGKYQFKLYNTVASPVYNPSKISQTQGNFVPFNDLSPGMAMFPDTNRLYEVEDANLGFGMTVEFDFIQPEGGKINGKDMTLDFRGDDDVFIFIDNKLVLDIGGCHEASAGSINFSTGEVINENVMGTGYIGTGQTVKSNMWEKVGSIFADGSRHNLKLFYTDRGNATNCKMRFNIPQAPKESLTVVKELSNTDKQDYANIEFGFRLFVQQEGEQGYTLVGENVDAEIGAVDSETGSKLIITDGTFYLKAGQQAVFPELDKNIRYYVQEIGIKSSEFDKVLINGTEALPQAEAGGMYSVKSPEYKLSEQTRVTFTNHCSDENRRTLNISKKMKSGNGQNSDAAFHFKLKLETTAGQIALYEGNYDIYEGSRLVEQNKTASRGMILLKAGQTARIYQILSKTSFQVEETGLDDTVYQAPVYSLKGADAITGQNGISGEMRLGQNAEVTVTNSKHAPKVTSLTISKTADKYDSIHGDAVFTFKITNTDTKEVLYRTIRFTGEGKEEKKSVTIQDLTPGRYTVEELETLRYECADDVVQSVILDEDGGTVSFRNIKQKEDYYSDSDVVVNHFTMDEDGNIVITPDRVNQK